MPFFSFEPRKGVLAALAALPARNEGKPEVNKCDEHLKNEDCFNARRCKDEEHYLQCVKEEIFGRSVTVYSFTGLIPEAVNVVKKLKLE